MFALRNVANTFSVFFTNTVTANRTYTLPDYNGTFATLAGTETFSGKTLTTPVINGIPTGT